MKIKWKSLLVCLALPLAVGGLSALITNEAMKKFGELNQPPLSPPAWLFPVVWTILYLLMGLASYIVWTSPATAEQKSGALTLYVVQLVFNFFWSLFFFNGKVYLFSFIWLLVMEALIVATAIRFKNIHSCAGRLMIPYILWVAFAAYLNFGIFLLN
ncbi:MAG: tryptophan-rich sensory protein [Clostridia bacterium]|nr:tryptophan-rich sensory protein [Clostridia bacterium]